MTAHPSLAVIARSEAMQSVFGLVDTIAASDGTVLLVGETGVGKELMAEYIHHKSPRSEKPFIKIGLAALPPDLLESELFGHEKGAYTSASSEKKGLFELADTGTIFLDDIDDFPLPLQSKLLRVLESRDMMRVGGTRSIPIDVRVICASKLPLRDLVERQTFRSDLYYRINVMPITLPPLSERAEDIPLLVSHFLSKFAPEKNLIVSEEAMRVLVHYAWPGNVRELRNVIQRVSLFVSTTIEVKDLPAEIHEDNALNLLIKACSKCFTDEQMSFDEVVACLETNLLQQALRQSDGNRTHAARILRMNLSTLRDKIKKYRINGEQDSPAKP